MRLLYSASYNILIFIHFTIESFVDKDIIKLPLMDAATWTQQVEAGIERKQKYFFINILNLTIMYIFSNLKKTTLNDF